MSKIIKLTSENVKRLRAVEIKPDGNVVVIGGKNGAGKSSVLDSIQYALGGEPADKMPVRRGEEKAKVVVDLGDIVVRRTFTAAGGTALVVTNADGQKQSSPQAILDRLVGKLTFDPLAFSRERPAQQAGIMRGLVGLDFSKQDEEREKVFEERTAVNRAAKALEAQIAGLPKHDGIPDREESVAGILEEHKRAADGNAVNSETRQKARILRRNADEMAERLSAMDYEIERLTELLARQKSAAAKCRGDLVTAKKDAEAAEAMAASLRDVDLSPFRDRASKVEEINRKVRESKRRAELVKEFKAKSEASEKLTEKLNRLDSDKRKTTTAAKYPVAGLMFDTAGGVTLDGIPFEQCSAAEQLKVSVAVGLALNPKLRILLIRDGSLLDGDSMKTILKMAADADAQVWIERVGTDKSTSVVIEDGAIAGNGGDE